jgi:ABC-type branched-subunit amino acid transport system ATPase component
LLLLDGLLDGLALREASALAEAIADLGRDAGILITGRNAQTLALACDEVMLMANGVLVSG